MKHFWEAEVKEYPGGKVQYGNGWESDSVRPVSDDPKDRGLFIVTTYDQFFRPELEKSKNGVPPK